ncbi:MAG: anaerobic sulfatase maturase [Planctomycetota bacterium]
MRTFQLLIKPVGDRCNLRCKYCFYCGTEDLFEGELDAGRRAAPTMPDDVLEPMVREFLAYRMPQSIFCWQGGEPTLAGLEFFRRVVELQMKHGARGQVVGNAFQTNGVRIDRDWARFLAEYHFLVGLSVDGPREVHEAMRGRSFDAVMRAAQLFRQFGVEFNILTVVSQANVRRGAEVYRWFIDRGYDNLQFIPCREVREDGTLTPESITGEQFGAFLVAVFDEWWKDGVSRISERNIDSALAYHLQGEPTMCTYQARCSDYLLIERGGEVFPCDFFGRPEWLLGYLGDRPMHELVEDVRDERFGKLKGGAAAECRDCEWWPMCHGGCPRDRRADGKSHYCEGYRMFFAATATRLKQLAATLRHR